MKDLHFETLARISELIRSRAISSVEVTRALLDRIAQLDGKYRSYATVLADRAMSRAAAADAIDDGTAPIGVQPAPVSLVICPCGQRAFRPRRAGCLLQPSAVGAMQVV